MRPPRGSQGDQSNPLLEALGGLARYIDPQQPSSMGRALVDLRRQMDRATQAQSLLANVLSRPGGTTYMNRLLSQQAGAADARGRLAVTAARAQADFLASSAGQQHLARQESLRAAQADQNARAASARLQAQADFLASPAGRQHLAEQQGREARTRELGMDAANAQRQAQAGYLSSAFGQQHLAGQYGRQSQARLYETRAALAGEQARQTYYDSPQGRAAARQEEAAGRRLDAQRDRAWRAENVARHGAVAGGYMNFRADLAALNPYVAAARHAMARGLHYAGQASPTHVATLQGSQELLEAKLGSVLLPAIDRVSMAFQKAAAAVDNAPGWLKGGLAKGLGDLVGNTLENMTDWRRALLSSLTGGPVGTSVLQTLYQPIRRQFASDEQVDAIRKGAGGSRTERFARWMIGVYDTLGFESGGEKAALKRSYAGLPSAQEYGYEHFQSAAQMAALNSSPLDMEKLQEQLKNLGEEIGNLADVIRQDRDRRPPPRAGRFS